MGEWEAEKRELNLLFRRWNNYKVIYNRRKMVQYVDTKVKC